MKYAKAYEIADAMKFAAANEGFISLHAQRTLHIAQAILHSVFADGLDSLEEISMGPLYLRLRLLPEKLEKGAMPHSKRRR